MTATKIQNAEQAIANLNATAWWRGTKARAAGHSTEWYSCALAKYSDAERAAFMAGYNGEPLHKQKEST